MVAYKDHKSGQLKKALVLRGANGQELRAQGNARLRYTVTEDGCSVSPGRTYRCQLKVSDAVTPPQKSNGQWGKTVIQYRSQTASRLPVLDLGLMDTGKAEQEFSLDIGPVCFS